MLLCRETSPNPSEPYAALAVFRPLLPTEVIGAEFVQRRYKHTIGFIDGMSEGPFAVASKYTNGPALHDGSHHDVAVVCPFKAGTFVCLRFAWLGQGSQNRLVSIGVSLDCLSGNDSLMPIEVLQLQWQRLRWSTILPLTNSERERLSMIEADIVGGIADLFGSGEVASDVKSQAGGAACLRSNPSKVQRFAFLPSTPRAAKRTGSPSPKTPKAKILLHARKTVSSAALKAPAVASRRRRRCVDGTTVTATETPPKSAAKDLASQPNLACSGVDMGGLGRVVQGLLVSGATEIDINLGHIIVKKTT